MSGSYQKYQGPTMKRAKEWCWVVILAMVYKSIHFSIYRLSISLKIGVSYSIMGK